MAATADSDNSRECQLSAQETVQVPPGTDLNIPNIYTVNLKFKYMIRNLILEISAQLKAQVRSEIQMLQYNIV